MKKMRVVFLFLILVSISTISFGQSSNMKFKLEGKNPKIVVVNQTFNSFSEIKIEKTDQIYGFAVSADIKLADESSKVSLVLVDKNFDEYLIYEGYPLLESELSYSIEEICEETCLLNGIQPYSIQVQVTNAEITVRKLIYTTSIDNSVNIGQLKKEKKNQQDQEKINKLNKNLKEKGLHWVAGNTSVSEMTYAERKKLYGQSTFPAGFEYYCGGVISTSETGTSGSLLKSASASPYVDEWDWRDRQGKNWITPIRNQGTCGSCWAFASTGATEAMVNLYFNQQLNLDLSEQDVLSCSGGGDCGGGYPSIALNYITNTGIVDEASFPYAEAELSCNEKSKSPSELIKTGGRVDFGSSLYPRSEDDLKRMLIEMGPLSGGLYDWSHAMTLVGYKVIKEGDYFYLRDLDNHIQWVTISAGDALIGTTVWIFKNSWGLFGDDGYVYVETPITNIGWTHGLKTPIISNVENYNVICEDNDGDGYYWWGIGPKPATCTGPDEPDGDDSDPTLGPLDQYGYCIPLGPVSAPVADFNADNTTITEGGSVTYSDASTNNPTSWLWSFEGGNPATSTAQNPTVSYPAAGDYMVTLTVTNSIGEDTKTVDNYITVNPLPTPPVADFSADQTQITEGGSVTFSDISTQNPTSWLWSFEGGDPATSTAQNPTVSYSTAGDYMVTLTVTNFTGKDTKTVDNFIAVNPLPTPPV
ncbi:MAG TPA: C1 family peptidase, partial [Draconibacterium sp.]|nr:C1 family peptidase [Draconibacterium sp.]